jgi:hypothetical protein
VRATSLLLACFGLAVVPRAAKAADGVPAAAPADDVGKARLDLSTPDVPAFTALGVSPSKISTPTNIKDFVAAISSGISSTGQVQNGVAIEVAPAQLVLDYDKKKPDESTERLARYLGGLTISIGTNALSNTTTPTMQAAVGARWSIWGYTPQADPTLAKCITQGIPSVVIPLELDENGQPLSPVQNPDTPDLKKLRQACRDRIRVAHLASTAFQIAYVHSAQAIGDTKWSSFSTLADTVWVSASWGINKAKPPVDLTFDKLQVPVSAWGFQPTLFVRYDATNLGAGAGRQADLFVAGRLPYITPGWSAFAEGGFKKLNVGDKASPPATSGTQAPVGLGADLRLNDGTWFGVYAGADLKSGEIFSLGNVKWSIGEKRPYEY